MADTISILKSGNHAAPLPVLAAAATDDAFVGTPPDGTLVVANGVLSVRVAGVWRTIALDA